MFGRMKLVSASCMLFALTVAGCGDASSAHQPTAGHEGGVGGHGGGQHALGDDPKEELARIKKAGGAVSTPGRLPGR